MVIIAVIATGCVDEGKPKYIPGDIIAEKQTSDTFTVILDYNQNTDEYKTNYISKVAGEWRHLTETKHESWENRRDIEDIYPVKIDHVDLTTVMSWDEHLKEMGYESVSETPTIKPKYSPGDIIAKNQTDTDLAWVILDYNQNTDEYKTNYISKVAGEWQHLTEIEFESWEDREFIESYNPVKIDHVDLTTIMSWNESLKEGGIDPDIFKHVLATHSRKPKYSPGDVIAEKQTTEVWSMVICDYNQNTDEYKTNYIHKDAEGRQVLGKTESWEDRDSVEIVLPVKIDHVDLATVMSWDEYSKAVGYEEVSTIPTTKQKYTPGDIMASKQTGSTFGDIILEYNPKTDEYLTTLIYKAEGEWRHFSITESKNWYDEDAIEILFPFKIDHVDLTTIMSWDEYYEGISATPKTTQKSGITGIKIIYSGKWSGSYGDLSGMKSIEGSGSKTISMPDADMIISAAIQKQDESNRKLTLQILKNGKVMEESDTTAAYGVVSAAHTISAF